MSNRTDDWQDSLGQYSEESRRDALTKLATAKVGSPIYYKGYSDNLAIWSYMDTTYRGGPGYVLGRDAHGQPLFAAHGKESREEARKRQLKSTFVNYPKLLVDRFHGYITKEPPIRKPAEGSLFADFFQDVDGKGTTAVDFWSDVCRRALITSPVWITVSTTGNAGILTKADEARANAGYILDWVHPSRVIDYEMDGDRLVRVAILQSNRIKASIADPEAEVVTIKELYPDIWRLWKLVTKDSGKTELVMLSEGPHGFSDIPIVPAFVTSPDPECPIFSQSLLHNLADIARDIFRVSSLTLEEAYNKVFTTLVLTGTNTKDLNKAKSQYVLTLGDPAAKAYAIGSDPSQLMVLIELQNQLTKTFFRVGHMEASGDPFDKRVAESGDKKSRDMEGLYQFLATLADGMERAENYINRLIAAASGEELIETNWPDDFDIKTLGEELTELERYFSNQFPHAFIAEIQKAIMNRKFPRLRSDLKRQFEQGLNVEPNIQRVDNEKDNRIFFNE